jgi:hypothetical protein
VRTPEELPVLGSILVMEGIQGVIGIYGPSIFLPWDIMSENDKVIYKQGDSPEPVPPYPLDPLFPLRPSPDVASWNHVPEGCHCPKANVVGVAPQDGLGYLISSHLLFPLQGSVVT